MPEQTDEPISEGVPPPPLNAGGAPKWADASGAREEKEWSKLDKVKLSNDLIWLRAYGLLLVTVTVVFTLAFLGAFVAWIAHYVTPWCWLSEDQLGKIQSVLFSGGMGAVVSNIIRKQVNKA